MDSVQGRLVKSVDPMARLKKKTQFLILRSRDQNKMASRIHDKVLTNIHYWEGKQGKIMNKQRRLVESELQQFERDKESASYEGVYCNFKHNKFGTKEAKIVDEQQEVLSWRPGDGVELTAMPRGKTEHVTCQYKTGLGASDCKNFPCVLPISYNSLSLDPIPKQYDILESYQDYRKLNDDETVPLNPTLSAFFRELQVQREKSAVELQSDYIEGQVDPFYHKSSFQRSSIKDREQSLKKAIREMKERNKKTREPAWVTNYGKPVPRKRLLKPIVPSDSIVA